MELRAEVEYNGEAHEVTALNDQGAVAVAHWIPDDPYGSRAESIARTLAAAINAPDGVELHATATGAWLAEHDPNGEQWERRRLVGDWLRDHARAAAPTFLYLIRPIPPAPTPETEWVEWGACLGRRLASNGGKIIGVYIELDDGVPIVNTANPNADKLWQSADGMVEVLPEREQ